MESLPMESQRAESLDKISFQRFQSLPMESQRAESLDKVGCKRKRIEDTSLDKIASVLDQLLDSSHDHKDKRVKLNKKRDDTVTKIIMDELHQQDMTNKFENL